MKNKIGVIVPVYKIEKYIAECIESILTQSYTNFQLILVDDGSPDNAGHVCDEYARKDPRITVIHQQNAGANQARANGVKEAASCEYIMFVDGDDTITEDTLELFLARMNEGNYDIVVGHFRPFTNIDTDIIPIERYRYLLLTEQYISPGPVCKLFKKSLFNEFTFDISRELIIAEDAVMNTRLSFNTNKPVGYIQKETYNYRLHQESMYHSHIRTPENEQVIQYYRINSIPADLIDIYINATIEIRLLRSREFWGYRYCVKGMKNTEFYKQLRSDIKEYSYRMPLIDSIIFNHSCPVIRFFAINTKKLMNILKYSGKKPQGSDC